jgi:1,4-dihydroxy-2-naphthoate octaprenyltransferase
VSEPKSYPRLRIWLLAARPKTLWAAIAPVIIGTAMSFDSGGFHLLSSLAALSGAVFIQIGTNYANDYYDFIKGADRDNRLGPTRVTQAGLVTPSQVKKAALLTFGLAFLIGIYLVYRGGWPIVIIGLSAIAFGILYTAGPFALGYKGLGEIFVLIFFGPVAVGGTYYVQTSNIDWPVIVAGLSPGLISVGILTINNLRDIQSDTTSGKRTLSVRFGVSYSQYQYTCAIFMASIIPVILMLETDSHPYAVAALLTLPAALPAIKKVFTYQNGEELNRVLENTGRLLLLFSLLFSFGWLL